jgi:hypothetical protein
MAKKSHLQWGIAQLAVTTKAIILPVINDKDSEGCNIFKNRITNRCKLSR